METSYFSDEILRALPRLRGFAIALSGSVVRADDLVQETLVKAWTGRESFARGTNMNAWLLTILRNEFITERRKRRREVEDVDGRHAAALACHPDQDDYLELQDCTAALANMRPDQREALLLVAVEGLSFEQAAKICDVPIPTFKNRVYRGRDRLAQLLGLGGPEAPSQRRRPGHRATAGSRPWG